MQLNKLINAEKKEFDRSYVKFLQSHLSKEVLSKAMIYGSINGGKRIRPFLVSTFAKISKIKKKSYRRISFAIESIHSYSLIHDDLPSMDNDDYRRGKLSTHKKFNEAVAILAGDALHDLAFEILSDIKTHPSSKKRILIINELAKTLGSQGLAGGQSLDLLYENNIVSTSKIINMYKMKTAKLFSFCCVAPFILANKSKKEIKFAYDFGQIFGLLFQITDDLLDNEKDFKSLGKTPGKDKKQGKSTLSSLKNKEKVKIFCMQEIKKFENKNRKYLIKNELLKSLIYYNLNRFN